MEKEAKMSLFNFRINPAKEVNITIEGTDPLIRAIFYMIVELYQKTHGYESLKKILENSGIKIEEKENK